MADETQEIPQGSQEVLTQEGTVVIVPIGTPIPEGATIGRQNIAPEIPQQIPQGIPSTSPISQTLTPQQQAALSQVNQPTPAGELKTPTMAEAQRAREIEIQQGVQNPQTIQRWNEILIADYNARVQVPSYEFTEAGILYGKIKEVKPELATGGIPEGKVAIKLKQIELTDEQQYAHYLSTGQLLPSKTYVIDDSGETYYINSEDKDILEQSTTTIKQLSLVTPEVLKALERIKKSEQTELDKQRAIVGKLTEYTLEPDYRAIADKNNVSEQEVISLIKTVKTDDPLKAHEILMGKSIDLQSDILDATQTRYDILKIVNDIDNGKIQRVEVEKYFDKGDLDYAINQNNQIKAQKQALTDLLNTGLEKVPTDYKDGNIVWKVENGQVNQYIYDETLGLTNKVSDNPLPLPDVAYQFNVLKYIKNNPDDGVNKLALAGFNTDTMSKIAQVAPYIDKNDKGDLLIKPQSLINYLLDNDVSQSSIDNLRAIGIADKSTFNSDGSPKILGIDYLSQQAKVIKDAYEYLNDKIPKVLSETIKTKSRILPEGNIVTGLKQADMQYSEVSALANALKESGKIPSVFISTDKFFKFSLESGESGGSRLILEQWDKLSKQDKYDIASIFANDAFKNSLLGETVRGLEITNQQAMQDFIDAKGFGKVPQYLKNMAITTVTIPATATGGLIAKTQLGIPTTWEEKVFGIGIGLSSLLPFLPASIALRASIPLVVGLEGVGSYSYVKNWNNMSNEEKALYGTFLAMPIAFGAKGIKDTVVYAGRKPFTLAKNVYDMSSISLEKGMPSAILRPGIPFDTGVDIVQTGQSILRKPIEPIRVIDPKTGLIQEIKQSELFAPSEQVDIMWRDPQGNYQVRLTPIERAGNILAAKGLAPEKLYTWSVVNDTSWLNKGNPIPAKISSANPIEHTVGIGRVGASKDWMSTFEYASGNAWASRIRDIIPKLKQGYLYRDGRYYDNTGKEVSLREAVSNKYPRMEIIGYISDLREMPNVLKSIQNFYKQGNYEGAEVLLRTNKVSDKVLQLHSEQRYGEALQRLFFDLNESGQLNGQYPAFRALVDQRAVEPEYPIAQGTKEYVVGKGGILADSDFYSVDPLMADKLKDKLPNNWDRMTRDVQDRWYYDRGAAIKLIGQGEKIPLTWVSVGTPEGKPPNYLTRIMTEGITEPYTRIKRLLKLFSPSTKVVEEFGAETQLPSLRRAELESATQGQVHVQSPKELFAVKELKGESIKQGYLEDNGKYFKEIKGEGEIYYRGISSGDRPISAREGAYYTSNIETAKLYGLGYIETKYIKPKNPLIVKSLSDVRDALGATWEDEYKATGGRVASTEWDNWIVKLAKDKGYDAIIHSGIEGHITVKLGDKWIIPLDKNIIMDTRIEVSKNEATIIVGKDNGSGLVVLPDKHGSISGLTSDINGGFDNPIISGSPRFPSTVNWNIDKQVVVQLGDIIDRGRYYSQLRDIFNKGYEQAIKSGKGGQVIRLLGNHELAYLTGQKIHGIDYSNAKLVAEIRKGIIDDILGSKAKASFAYDNQLFTHAGLNVDKYPEYRGMSPNDVSKILNDKLIDAVKRNDYSDKIFDSQIREGGKSDKGGIFWARPDEGNFNLGYKQFYGHTPEITYNGISWAITERQPNAINVETATWWDSPLRDKAMRTYYDTPTIKSIPTGKLLASIGEGDVINYTSSNPELLRQFKNIQSNMDRVFPIEAFGGKRYPFDELGLSVKMPDNITITDKVKFNSEFGKILRNSDLTLDYKLIGGYPSDYAPNYLYLGIKDDATLAKLIDLQKQVDKIAESMGYKQGDIKIQSGINLAEMGMLDNVLLRDTLAEIMKQQPEGIRIKVNELRLKDYEGKVLTEEQKTRLANTKDLVEKQRQFKDIYDDYPPATPDGQLSYTRIPYYTRLYEGVIPTEYISEYPIEGLVKISESIVEEPLIEGEIKEGYISEGIPEKGIKDGYAGEGYSELGMAEVGIGEGGITEKGITEISGAPYPPYPNYPPYVPTETQIEPPIITPTLITIIPKGGKYKEKVNVADFEGAIGWKQGALMQGRQLKDQWYIIKKPYKSELDMVRIIGEPPPTVQIVKGLGSAYKTIQTITGLPPNFLLEIDMGAFDIAINKPTKKAGATGAIKFSRDFEKKTQKQMDVKSVSTVRI